MNIDDVPVEQLMASMPAERIAAIFKMQQELMLKYEPMEARRGLLIPHAPFHIDEFAVQNRIKDMFWRATEEVAEAFEEFDTPGMSISRWREKWDNDVAIRHFFEELADSLHFLTEASIYANLNVPDDFIKNYIDMGDLAHNNADSLRLLAFRFVHQLGLAANCLKNKPWKQSQMPTDESKFKANLVTAWSRFGFLWGACGATLEDLYILYARKNLVNQFRQRSNY